MILTNHVLIYVSKEGVNMSIENTREYQQSIKMRPACDRILCETFNITSDKIKRFNRADELFILDREFHIDLILTLNNGTQITGQEKALAYEYSTFETFTIEFYQNRFTGEHGEFFKIASQFYLHGYSDESGIDFKEWVILDVLKFMNYARKYPLEYFKNHTRAPDRSRASFFYIRYDEIPDECIIFRKEREPCLF